MARVPITVDGTVTLTAYGKTLQPEKAGPRTFIPLACDLGDTSVEDAATNASKFVETLGVHPGDPAPVQETFTRIQRWAETHDIHRLADLVAEKAEALICELAEVPDLEFTPPRHSGKQFVRLEDVLVELYAARERAHYVHNCLVALRSATVLTRTRSRKVREVADTLAWGLPELPSLEDRTSRPLTDEEIMLGRFLVEINIREDADPRPDIAYLLAATGVRTAESTTLDTDELDDRHQPTTINAPGVWEFKEREVEFDPYVAATLPILLRRLREGVQRLTYDGNHPGRVAASNSLSATLTRNMRRAGITDPATTPKSLNFWRPFRALCVDADPVAACRYHGGAIRNLLVDLRLTTVEDRLALGVIYLQRQSTGEIVAELNPKALPDKTLILRRPKKESEAA